MNIFIAGLGLIGGSLARAISSHTCHSVFGFDRSPSACGKALAEGAVSAIATEKDITDCDIIIVALYPGASIEFLEQNCKRFKKGAIVIDTCGIKSEICEKGFEIADKNGFTFIGGHPMAGVERSGFEHSFASLFDGASMILCPSESTKKEETDTVSSLCEEIGFGRITISTPSHHDKVIAFTSQLAHLVSSAYVAGEYATEHKGFSAGSYKDMTRVARLNADMWTELFFENKENLSCVCTELIGNLAKFKDALDKGDRESVHKMLSDGNERKIISDSL